MLISRLGLSKLNLKINNVFCKKVGIPNSNFFIYRKTKSIAYAKITRIEVCGIIFLIIGREITS